MDIITRIGREKRVVLFGQEDYLFRVSSYLDELFPSLEKVSLSFALEHDKPDSTDFDLSLYDNDLKQINVLSLVILTFSCKFHNLARTYLKKRGFTNTLLYDSNMDNTLKKEFFAVYFKKCGREFVLLDDVAEMRPCLNQPVHIYQARSIFDKPVSGEQMGLQSAVIPIQVGAAITDERIASLTDYTGENISSRNKRYSEMTAFYWMWKNDTTPDYLGLCHYRRLWVDLDRIIGKLQTTDVDAVLPLPTLCEHSVHGDYLLKHIPTVWKPMMKVMKRRSPVYYEAAQEIFKGKIFYASNMCILRREVLDDLCEWMFPIVMEVEEIVGDIEDPYYNRYAGFCTERLITLYFLYNKHHWKIAHAEKIFIN